MKQLAILISATIALTSGASLAAEPSRFDGFYAGFFAGYGAASFKGIIDSSEITDGFPLDAEVFSDELSSAAIYGGFLGVNRVTDGVLLGTEASVTFGDLSSYTVDDGGNDFATQELKGLLELKARAGAVLDDQSLLFAALGFGLAADTVTAYNDYDDPDDAESGSLTTYRPVLSLGLGYEAAVTEQLGFRIEGTYLFGLKDYEFSEDELTSDMDLGDFANIDKAFLVRAGLIYRFQ